MKHKDFKRSWESCQELAKKIYWECYKVADLAIFAGIQSRCISVFILLSPEKNVGEFNGENRFFG